MYLLLYLKHTHAPRGSKETKCIVILYEAWRSKIFSSNSIVVHILVLKVQGCQVTMAELC